MQDADAAEGKAHSLCIRILMHPPLLINIEVPVGIVFGIFHQYQVGQTVYPIDRGQCVESKISPNVRVYYDEAVILEYRQ